MGIEIVEVKIRRYYKDNEPTCAINFKADEVCQFYRSIKFGTKDTCLFAPQGSFLIELGRGDKGFLKPGSWCPVFYEYVENEEFPKI